MIESFNDFLKKSNCIPVLERNSNVDRVVETVPVPEESLKTGGDADKEMWEKEVGFTFEKPEFVFENPYMSKISSIVLKALKKNFNKEWDLYPYLFLMRTP